MRSRGDAYRLLWWVAMIVKHLAGAAPSLQRGKCISGTDRLVAGYSPMPCQLWDGVWGKRAHLPIYLVKDRVS